MGRDAFFLTFFYYITPRYNRLEMGEWDTFPAAFGVIFPALREDTGIVESLPIDTG